MLRDLSRGRDGSNKTYSSAHLLTVRIVTFRFHILIWIFYLPKHAEGRCQTTFRILYIIYSVINPTCDDDIGLDRQDVRTRHLIRYRLAEKAYGSKCKCIAV